MGSKHLRVRDNCATFGVHR